MTWPTGLCPVSFLGFVHPSRASPFAVPHLSQALTPAPSETILAKVLAMGQKKSMEATTQQLLDLGMELPLPPPTCK